MAATFSDAKASMIKIIDPVSIASWGLPMIEYALARKRAHGNVQFSAGVPAILSALFACQTRSAVCTRLLQKVNLPARANIANNPRSTMLVLEYGK